ncbi:DUF4191 domain-containing protein [Georgenia sp. H159]|uniref:DUF4191 domain-containing protein n=1 Tax=Georgenia sp. H159 TaxID=3076115 RepID=UPI002D78FF38|nr:DUF4191 domain-containing protein [Georgenia sp. H159]
MALKRTKKDAVEGAAPKPKKKRWYHQLWEVFQMTREAQPSIVWWLLGAFVGILVVGLAIGFAVGHPVYVTLLSLPIALIVVMLLLSRRAERAAYSRIEGTPGAAGSALGTIRRGWNIEEQPVAIDPRHQDVVFRAVGRPGVVLIGEGPSHRVKRLLESERRKVARVAPNVTVHLVEVGREEGQTPLPKLVKKIQKLRPTLTKAEVAAVSKRLRALQSSRPPIPKGVDPLRARPDRKGMRGR